MNKQTTKATFIVPIVMEDARRRFLWLVLGLAEVLATLILTLTPQNAWYFAPEIGLTVGLFMVVNSMGEKALVRDLRELCFYDVLVQILGLAFYHLYIQPMAIIALATAITILKIVRLTWPCKRNGGGSYDSWPIFGVLGYLHARKHRFKTNQVGTIRSQWNDIAAYTCMAAALPVGYLYNYTDPLIWIIVWVTVPLAYLLVYMRRHGSDLDKMEEHYFELVETLAKERENSAANAAALAAGKERERLLAEVSAAREAASAAELAASTARETALKEKLDMLNDVKHRNEALRDANHDMKQPIVAAVLNLQELSRLLDIASQDAPVRQVLQNLSEGLSRCENMVEDIIHYAKIATRHEEPKSAPVATADFALDLYQEFAELAKAKNIKFLTIVDDLVLRSDRELLWRIVCNLTRNAIVHTSAGSVRAVFRNVSADCGGPGCAIEVWDCGPHHDADSFDAFCLQKKAESKTRGKGFGLGLGIIKRLAESIGATVVLERRSWGGSVFWLKIPVYEGATEGDLPALLENEYTG